ncbi:AAA family ATPase [Erysipelothrix tonsillarum]|uniref:AAA family ATPase n=1 Tax=Erysipelothrix tonsillarum TaxID=38402 RepID=UPI00037BEEA8|nr:AAA family ATPase [Erysipelothrix tonsillarum]
MLIEVSKLSDENVYPYNTIDFNTLDLDSSVVFFTGENGSGKSTLLRAIAHQSNSYSVSKKIDYQAHRYDRFSLAWHSRLKRGYYFQSEDFYSFLNWISEEEIENEKMYEDALERHGENRSMGVLIELGMHEGNRKHMDKMVTELKEASHGEGYIRFFASKLRPNTLYLLDEPETPLSFQNQLTLMTLINDYVKQGSQFIICTHSPILLAYPDAKIYYFDETITSMSYDEHPIVRDYSSFMNRPQQYLYYLFEDEN